VIMTMNMLIMHDDVNICTLTCITYLIDN
jgi:hypothetical protein